MSADELALLAGVRDAPHDDTPRLVYADWLDEHGNAPRAEFIRVQCELALPDPADPAFAPLAAREKFLWHRYRERFRETFRGNLRGYPFRRGFPHPRVIGMGLDVLLTHPADRFDAVPDWRLNMMFKVGRVVEQMEQLAACPRLLRLSHVGFWLMTDTHAEILAASPFARNLRAVVAGHDLLTARGVRTMVESPNLPNLGRIECDAGNVTVTRPGEPGASALTVHHIFGVDRPAGMRSPRAHPEEPP